MIYFFLAEGFEEIEALCPIDLLRRAGLAVTTVGVGGKEICGSHGIKVAADIIDTEYNDKAPELIFLPGGMPGTLNLKASDTVMRAIKDAVACDAYIAAICAAPMILGELGLLCGKEAICYPGFEDELKGAKISDKRIVRDGKILTAKGMGVALDFGLMIVELFCGKQKADDLRHAVIAD
jgi:4-methyl-5(b-hydroxyethyl)-thiazole monophosphate biosynthesis